MEKKPQKTSSMAPAPIKVVHLITLLEFGGAQGNTIHTVQNLNPENFEAQLWTGKGAYWDKEIEETLGLVNRVKFIPSLVRQINPLMDLLAFVSIWKSLVTYKPTILHTHSSKAGIIGRIAGKLAGVPIIIHTFHGFGFNDQQKPWTRGLFVFLEKLTARMSNGLIFVSESNQRTAQELHIGNPDQYVLIRSGIPLAKIRTLENKIDRNEFRAKQGIPTDSRVVVTIGAFKPQKNLFDFLDAAKIISDSIPNAFFVILGDGSLRKELENYAQKLGIKDQILMPGWREDATSFLAASDVFAMTSLWEGLPRALVESMALGIPAVCYDTDGVRDLLKQEEGTLIPQRDVQGLAQAIQALLNDKEHLAHLSEVMKSRINNGFDIDHMVREQERFYRILIRQNP